jgi:mono/diheme cytochrome c family protein
MKTGRGTVGLLVAALAFSSTLSSAAPSVDFQRDIRPLLARKCFACHGPDEHARQANLRLDLREAATGQSGGYPGIIPGSSAKSRVYIRITHPTRPMPPVGERLSAAEVDLIRRWIDEGAPYAAHWAFVKPKRPALPEVRNRAWVRNEIDYFVLARLEREGLNPSPAADRYTLARRVALDMTGLPPALEMVDEFVKDRRPDAYERLVDRLLASPHYGERWARMWLDLARYADTQGYEKDNRRTIWPYRDWVIRAFNSNMPFDQFTLKQLAGDLLPSPTEDDLIATGFHRNTMTNTEGGTDDEEFRDAAVKDRVAVTGQVWMGLTWGCAQCHSHKYDPLSHTEFYGLYAFFNQTEDNDQPDDRPVLQLSSGASTLILRELPEGRRRITRIHQRGNFLDPGPVVEPRTPSAFHPFPADAPRNRLGLAKWLVSAENPLTARVTVNRFWARLFGRGLVETEEDFGTQGNAPSHPELLDWLATEFMAKGWDVKALLRTIVTSATYRQNSATSPELQRRDPENRLLARGPRLRLEAEMVRDQALFASGLLSTKMYGPPVMPWQPEGVWQIVYSNDQWRTSQSEDRYRRSLYTFARRSAPYPSMINFDAPSGEVCTMRRIRTNTPLQALNSLNDPVLFEAAQYLALRVLDEAQTSRERAERLFRLVLIRPPERAEVERLLVLHKEAEAELLENLPRAQKLLHYDQLLYSEQRDRFVIEDARGRPPVWKYSLQEPPADWTKPGFDDGAWPQGKTPFGYFKNPTKNASVQTTWDSEQIWLRLEFALPGPMNNFRLLVRCQGLFEAFINGLPAAYSPVERGSYEYRIEPQAADSIKTTGNVLAVRARRISENEVGQLIDVGLLGSVAPDFDPPQRADAARAAWVVVASAVLNLDETVSRR